VGSGSWGVLNVLLVERRTDDLSPVVSHPRAGCRMACTRRRPDARPVCAVRADPHPVSMLRDDEAARLVLEKDQRWPVHTLKGSSDAGR
jgi:hypothetical protein